MAVVAVRVPSPVDRAWVGRTGARIRSTYRRRRLPTTANLRTRHVRAGRRIPLEAVESISDPLPMTAGVLRRSPPPQASAATTVLGRPEAPLAEPDSHTELDRQDRPDDPCHPHCQDGDMPGRHRLTGDVGLSDHLDTASFAPTPRPAPRTVRPCSRPPATAAAGLGVSDVSTSPAQALVQRHRSTGVDDRARGELRYPVSDRTRVRRYATYASHGRDARQHGSKLVVLAAGRAERHEMGRIPPRP